ncbi:MAG TPA: hypothetical protein DDX39_06295 [Bacteroidales bacterium]|nr:MAG: hypothetical protein A2W98_00530 [Bacteroidetes bacterium GWF2_33_38]OFY71740.1 MAG: hypothetical protein A2265_02865 [Bacteroidetes bacterium RIFOXYA12_FULL_33_9]OFY90215.1 MAG: hypothetical protein A2236_02715 [Bacteroidetes bacterium RIFOXYA2_FULL_33_7]HBF88235.1 hypothetical protein [Bacteroidales bacterium]
MKKLLGFILVLFVSIPLVVAQNISFKASAPKAVSIGEAFRLTYSLNSKGSNLRMPNLDEFNVLSGPNTSSSSSVSIVNGQMSQTVEYTYTFILQAKKAGKFKIPASTISANGNDYTCNELNIEVVQGKVNNAQATNSETPQATTSEISGEDLYIRVHVSRNSVYQGEHILATIKIYTKLDLAGFENSKLPDFNGFWTQDLEIPNQISLQQENVGGEIYNVGVIKKMLLYPQHGGDIVIEPCEFDCIVRQRIQGRRRSMFDDFFGGSYQNIVKKILSPKVTINVKSLPANKPESYTGAVGDLKMTASIDKLEVNTNDAITMKVIISGNGNLKLIEEPKIDFPPDFEAYDPKLSTDIKNSENGSSGSKIYEYLIIPRHAGKFRIPPFEFSYFDVKSKSYKTISSEEYEITVNKGENDEGGTVVSNFSKEDVKYIGRDIRFIKTAGIRLSKKDNYIFGSLFFNILYPLATVLFVVLLVLRRKRIRENSNLVLVKNKKANKMAKKRLNLSNKYLKENNKEQFYTEVLRALWGYLSDKLGIPLAELSKDNVVDALQQFSISDEEQSQLSSLIDNCEFARFAPEASSISMNEMYENTIQMISLLDNKIKKVRS